MRFFIFTTFVVLFSLIQSFGQISFGVKAGLNLCNAKNIGITGNKTRLGLHGGLLSEIGISNKFIFRPELLYSIKGFKFPPTDLDGGGTLNLNYVSIPLLGGFRYNDKFTILLGPEFNFLTNANSKFNGSDHDVSKSFGRFDLAIDLGASYNINNGLGVEIRYSYGLTDLADVIQRDQFGNEIEDGIGRNRVFQLALFYMFSKK